MPTGPQSISPVLRVTSWAHAGVSPRLSCVYKAKVRQALREATQELVARRVDLFRK
jgi:hypothetical protein